MKRLLNLVLAVAAAACVYAQGEPPKYDLAEDFGSGELGLFMGASAGYDENLILNAGGGLLYTGENLALIAEAYLRRDGIYGGTTAQTSSGGFGGFYFRIEAGGVAYRKGDFLLRAGWLPHYDVVDSPYSLFINGDGLTAPILELSYDDGRFFYSSRWIGLNHDSDIVTTVFNTDGFPDRGANVTNYGVRFGDMTFGIQDAIVYCGQFFDWEYFLSPVPDYIIQDARRQNGTPWTEEGEENNTIGLYWIWDRPDGWKIHAQWLLDDGNLYWLSPKIFPKHQPFKMAWSGGFTKDTSLGRFSFYHAGATKYTFEPTYGKDDMVYGYAYYPDTVFSLRDDTTMVPIPFETMMLGYKHGENNLAFLGKWINRYFGFDVGASLEFTVSGSKSPANAWHEESWHGNQGSELLAESPLEWKILATVGGSRQLGDFFLFANLSLGYVFHELELVDGPGGADGVHEDDPYNDVGIWKPSDTNRFLFAATIGGRYRLKIK